MPVDVTGERAATWAIPKSATCTRPSGESRMLLGLMSRWMRPRTCAAAESVGDLLADARDGGRGQRSVLAESHGKVAAGHLLHDDVGPGRVGPEVVDLHDVGVAQGRGGLGLVAEALHELGVTAELRAQDLDGHLAAELAVRGAEDGGHATLTEDLVEPVAAGQDPAELSHAACPPEALRDR